jgi:hypothetical protein
VRRRTDVEILRAAADQKIADASPDQIRRVVELAQPIKHPQCVRVDVAARQRVLGARDDPWLDHRLAIVPNRQLTGAKHLYINTLSTFLKPGMCGTIGGHEAIRLAARVSDGARDDGEGGR